MSPYIYQQQSVMGTGGPTCVNTNFGNGSHLHQQIPLPTPPPYTTLQYASVGQADLPPVLAPEKKRPGPKPTSSPKVEKPKRSVGRPKKSKDTKQRRPRGSLPPKGTPEFNAIKRKDRAAKKAENPARASEPSSSQEEAKSTSLPKQQRRQGTPWPSEEDEGTDSSAESFLAWDLSSQESTPLAPQHQDWTVLDAGFDQGFTALSAPTLFDPVTSSLSAPDGFSDDFFVGRSDPSAVLFAGTSFGCGFPS
jgi:hypothetical protein